MKNFYSLQYIEILDPINFWRFDLGPRPRDLPARVFTPKDLPPFKALKEDVAAQPAGSNNQISRGPAGPSDQGQIGAQAAPCESRLRTRFSCKMILLEDDVPFLEVEPLRQVEGSKKSKFFSL